MGKSGDNSVHYPQGYSQNGGFPGFSTVENVDNPTVHSGKMGKNTILYIVDGHKTAYKI